MTLGPGKPAGKARAYASQPTVLSVVCLAQFVVLVNGMIVFVALPAIQTDLAFGGSQLTWVVNAFTLTYGGFLLFGGRSADLFGHRRMFFLGLLAFSVTSALCGVSTTKPMLLVLRAGQGVGAALFSAAALAILTTAFRDGPERRKALATWSAVNAGSSAIGLLLGGVLTAALSWRFVFFAVGAGGIAILAVAAKALPRSPEGSAGGIDVGGAVTITGGVITLVYVVLSGRLTGWANVQTLGAAALSIALLAAFVVIQVRAETPLVRVGIFRARALAAANVTMFLVVGAPVTVIYLLTLHLQQTWHYSALKTAFALLPASAMVAVGSLTTRRLLSVLRPRTVLTIGLSLMAIGAGLLACLGETGHYVNTVLPGVLVTFLGSSCAIVTLIVLATSGLPETDAGLASGLINTTTQVGGGLWLAVFSSIAVVPGAMVLTGYTTALWGVAMLAVAGVGVVLLILRKRHWETAGIDVA